MSNVRVPYGVARNDRLVKLVENFHAGMTSLPISTRLGTLCNKLRIFDILSCTTFVEGKWCLLVEEKKKTLQLYLVTKFTQADKTWIDCSNYNYPHKILDFFSFKLLFES